MTDNACLSCGMTTGSKWGVCSRAGCTRQRNVTRGLVATDRKRRHCLHCSRPTLSRWQVCSREQCKKTKRLVQRLTPRMLHAIRRGTEFWACLSCRAPTASAMCVCASPDCRWLDRRLRRLLSELES